MANHKSALKRIRSNEKKKSLNKLQHKTTRNAIKKLKESKTKKEAGKLFPGVVSLIEKLAKKNVIHKNKASNLKSKLSNCLLYTSPSPRDVEESRMPSSA